MNLRDSGFKWGGGLKKTGLSHRRREIDRVPFGNGVRMGAQEVDHSKKGREFGIPGQGPTCRVRRAP